MYRYREYICFECGAYKEELFKKDDYPETLDCEECGTESSLQLKMVTPPVPLRASYHDGHSRGDSWELSKRAAKLEEKSMDTDWKDRGEYKKEIRELKKAAAKSKNNKVTTE